MGFPATNSATQKPPFSTHQPIPRRHFLVGWLVRSLYTTQSDSSRLAGAIALHNTVGL
ncbi:hypothetical protein [Limnospira indica]|uniref:hypothetical protein n=1 Tax=Limnospira indica TaxID=147322 RepID=UPI00186286F6|nr:hypothetical protein [Limnospira indica]QNH57664.1 MAG: hypothetical protein H2674_26960 [Limnospira indica BM01]